MTTLRNPEVGTSDFATSPAEREMAPKTPEIRKSELTYSDDVRRIAAQARWYFTPPAILTDTVPSIPVLRTYARTGRWTTSAPALDVRREKDAPTGPLRRLAIGYWRVVALPVAVVARSVEWAARRPLRATALYLVWRLVITHGPGPWVADHIIRPAASIAGSIFL